MCAIVHDRARRRKEKNSDLRDGHLLSLLSLFEANLDAIVEAFDEADFVELGPGALVLHRRRGQDDQS